MRISWGNVNVRKLGEDVAVFLNAELESRSARSYRLKSNREWIVMTGGGV